MRMLESKKLALLLLSMTCVLSAPVFADGFNLKVVNSLTEDGGLGMSDVEDLLGTADEIYDIPETDSGCAEIWTYTEVIMKGFKLIAAQVLMIYFDEDGYVCSTFITDGDKLSETKEREE